MHKRTGKTNGDVSGLDLSTLKYFYPLSLIVSAVTFLVTGLVFGPFLATGMLVGGIFGILNLGLIVLLSIFVLDPVRQNPVIAFLVFTFKIPIIYGVLVALFMSGKIDLMGFAAGFQLFIITLFVYLIAAHFSGQRLLVGKGDDTA